MIIIGIDPGTALTGYGLINIENQNKILPIAYGVINTTKTKNLSKRLLKIYKGIELIIDKYKPDEMAIEELFFSKNVKTGISVSHARGVVMLLAEIRNIQIYEYKPVIVKKTITGHGKADKKEMQKMVKILLELDKIPKPDDAADALAIAYTHSSFRRFAQYMEM
jgi:crossover junction endodeoxyribonuclease RuvC